MLALIMLFSMFGGAIAEEGESVSALIENALETVQPSAEETDSEVQRVMDKISAIGTVTAQSASAIQQAVCTAVVAQSEPAGALTKDVSAITLKYAGLEIELPIRVGGALKGSGAAEDPWKIESAADFETVRELVEQGVSFSGEYLEMTEDVTLPDGWSPIGASMSNPFSGNLNGADHTLTIPENGLPLLGCVSGAKVSRLNIYGKKIAGYGLVNDLQGMGYSGTAVELEHITLKSGSATLKSGLIGTTPTVNRYAGCSKNFIVKISDCTVESGVVIGYNRDQRMIGSIAGRVNGTISGCISAATVYGTDYVGGILGTRDNALGVCEVRNCAFTGAVIADGEQAGGVVGGGYSDSSAPNGVRISVIGCSASGSVSGHDKVGGILGGDSFVAQTWNASTFADNRFTGTISGSGSAVGGVIGCILDAQLENGGWAFTGNGADTDMTAMALQAIAPYYDPAADADNELNAAIERGVECLSMLQDSSGLFGTYAADGTMTATGESASQVIVALTALGIDPDQDERFIKNGVSALDALIHFGVANGGFAHLENAERDAMATEQGYYALTAYARYLMQLNRLYDMTDSFNDGENRIEPLRLYIGIAPKE